MADEAAAARRLGGRQRRKEAAVRTAFDFEGGDHGTMLWRLWEISGTEALSLPPGPKRVAASQRTIDGGRRLLGETERDRRISVIETTLGLRAEPEEAS